MDLMIYDSTALDYDAKKFAGFADSLQRICNRMFDDLDLGPHDAGFETKLAAFYDTYSEALSKLTNFLIGNDSPSDQGGVGAMQCTSRVLHRTAVLADTTAVEAEHAVAQLRDQV